MAGGRKNFLFALSILIGTVIGAGLFGLPYVIAQSGIMPGLFYFLILGVAMTVIHLLLGEAFLRTEGNCRLAGLAKIYLKARGEKIAVVSIILGSIGILLAYIVIGGDFLKILFSGSSESFYLSIFFWAVCSLFVFRGVKFIALAEFFTNIVFFLIIFIVFLFVLPKTNIHNFSLFNFSGVFLPYGVILFSLIGLNAVPEIIGFLKIGKSERNFKRVIIVGYSIVVIFYLLFAFIVVGISGSQTSPEAFQGLIPFLGGNIIFLGALAAVITLIDSFIVIGLNLKNVLVYDYRVNKILASLVVCGFPLTLFLLGFRNFIEIIGLVGIIVGTIQGILIILIFRKAKKLGDRKPEYSLNIPRFVLYLLIAIFIVGALSQFI
ncbi:MAG: aromatic amino acid transport family protein [Candidatus Omnitrophota bacterium]